MNSRIGTVIAVATLVTLSSGCCGTRNFLFGRGARCGPCSTPAPQFGNITPAPYPQAPYVAVPNSPPSSCLPWPRQPKCQTPEYYGGGGDCGCNAYAGDVYGRHVTGDGRCGGCGTCGDTFHGSTYGGDCGCGGRSGEYVTDPYLSSETVVPQPGQIYGDQVIEVPSTGVPMLPNTPQIIQEDDFTRRSNRLDTDGNKILWEQPLPAGTTSL